MQMGSEYPQTESKGTARLKNLYNFHGAASIPESHRAHPGNRTASKEGDRVSNKTGYPGYKTAEAGAHPREDKMVSVQEMVANNQEYDSAHAYLAQTHSI